MTGVLSDLADRRIKRLADDIDSARLVVVLALEPVERLGRIEQRNAATGDDAFLDRGTGRVKRVVDAILALLDLDLRRASDLDHRNATGELGEPLLQLLAIVIRGRGLDLLADCFGPRFDRLMRAGAVDDRRVVLVDRDALGLAEHGQSDGLELDAEIFADHFAAS